ncbi:MAG: hypothetical protein WA885_07700 [Phormidesmis sp.]
MTTLGTYTFLPWLRQGIANSIEDADLDPSVQSRASVNISLNLKGDPVEGTTLLERAISKDIELYGPGDIVGIDAKAILKAEPRNWITNFETNFLPYIDFYDEDFPWRYTPAKPAAANINRLRPWLMLVVLAEGEFEDRRGGSGNRPLPFIAVENRSLFPPAEDLWSWAHVHVNQSLIADDSDMVVPANRNGPVLNQFEQTLKQNPDLAYSRIVSPRKLTENTAYHAFLVPVFETGRLAGLGLSPTDSPFATQGAWDDYPEDPASRPEPTHYPIYHRWYFRTSTVGDFEYLVRLLQPRLMDSRVGRRDIDVQAPDANLPGIEDPELGGVLKLGGALQIPFDTLSPADQAEALKYDNWAQPYPHPFQTQLAALINLAEDYSRLTPEAANSNPDLPDSIKAIPDPDSDSDAEPSPDPDPLITPPIYGRWHAKTPRLLTDEAGDDLPPSVNANWVHDINLDPPFRVTAGFGTEVIKQNQETYMDAAWGQIGDILKANQQIRWAQMAKEISWMWYDNSLRSLKDKRPNHFLTLTAPLDRRVLVEEITRFHTVKTSLVPRAAMTAPMRRVMRSRARLIQRLDFSPERPPEALVELINNGEVFPAPPKETPPSLPTPDDIAEEMEPDLPDIIDSIVDWLRQLPRWLRIVILALLVLLTVLLLGLLGVIFAVVLVWFAIQYLEPLIDQADAADSVKEENQTPEKVDELPPSPDFVLTRPDEDVQPSQGSSDSVEATRFKGALKDAYRLIQSSRQVAEEPPKRSLNLPTLVTGTFQEINPEVIVPKATLTNIFIPPRIAEALFEIFEEAMAYPEFDIPMYKPLIEKSAELFLPNLQYITQNSISLLETNQRFIEAYMVGLNHEFARELLWREYPTDQRGSYFRQFWDASGFLDREDLDDEALREKLRDIPPLDKWSKFSDLGDHDNREKPGDNENELVLVIRGELLKKYPTAVIYAQRAKWKRVEGEIDKSQPRELDTLTAAEEDNPPPEKILTPLYEAKVEPDIYFFGFDLTAIEARGETPEKPNDAGWFFVIKERPGEPRFGFDIGEGGGTKNYWNDITWEDVFSDDAAGPFIRPTVPPGVSLDPPDGDANDIGPRQHAEDIQVSWNGSVSAAEMAYIMYQVPVLVAVHASDMLPEAQS